jgi:hypothetical protein
MSGIDLNIALLTTEMLLTDLRRGTLHSPRTNWTLAV